MRWSVCVSALTGLGLRARSVARRGRREIPRIIAIAALAVGAETWAAPDSAPSARPNFIVILADDLGYGDIGSYGSRVNATPNLDRMAREGLRFTDFHSNGPMCWPTRAALLSGRYQQRCGIEGTEGGTADRDWGGMPAWVQTFAETLRHHGYATGMYGKWHLGERTEYSPSQQGFDDFRGIRTGDSDYQSHVDRRGKPDWWHNDSLAPEAGYITDLITRHSIEFIERNRQQPFVLYVAHLAVHFPWQGPRDKAARVAGVNYWDTDAKLGTNRTDPRAAYAEMLRELDNSVGAILGKVKALGLEQNTLVLFLSDNGGHEAVAVNAPWRGYKGQVYEGGHRVPAMAWWPGRVPPGLVSDATLLTMDIFPTMLDAAKIPLPDQDEKLDGVSLLPLLTKGEQPPARTLFWRRGAWKAVRQDGWKLVVGPPGVELYYLPHDPAEQQNLARENSERVVALGASLKLWEDDVAGSYRRMSARGE